MKRKTVLLMGVLLVLCQFASCNAERSPDETTAPYIETEPTENDTAASSPEQTAAEHLALVKSFSQKQEWDGEILLALSEYTGVVLSEESAQMYPALAEILEQTHRMASRSMDDEFDNLLSAAKDEISLAETENFTAKLSTLDVQIRRADSIAVSVLSDYYMIYGQINGRFLHGSTYDTATGKALLITDVIRDMSEIPAIVKKELQSYTWTGDFYTETAVEDYFSNTPVDGIAWTLDYNGVTFYFGNGDLAELGNGRLAATVTFAEYPELFEPKYMTVPGDYIVELSLNHPFYADLDSDGAPEELNVTPFTHESGLLYDSFGVYIDSDAHFAEFPADIFHRTGGYHPYYVQTADGRHYLYVFAEGNEKAAGDMRLKVIDVSDSKIKEVGDLSVAPGYIPIDQSQVYRVGEGGLPSRKYE